MPLAIRAAPLAVAKMVDAAPTSHLAMRASLLCMNAIAEGGKIVRNTAFVQAIVKHNLRFVLALAIALKSSRVKSK